MSIFRGFLFSFLVVITNSAFAYIPSADMVLSRLAENQGGNGIYMLEQEVHLKSGENWKVHKERWYVSDDGKMRLAAWPIGEGTLGWKYNFIYEDGQKVFQTDGKFFRQKVGADFVEELFHMRGKSQITQWMIDQGVIANAGQIVRRPKRDGLKFTYPRETHLRLGRSGGVIAYLFAKKDYTEENPVPGLWVEQDQFHIIKARFSSGTEVKASQFEKADKLYFPGLRELTFSTGEARIKLLKLSKLPSSAETRNLFNSSELKEKSTLPSVDSDIKLFYERFR